MDYQDEAARQVIAKRDVGQIIKNLNYHAIQSGGEIFEHLKRLRGYKSKIVPVTPGLTLVRDYANAYNGIQKESGYGEDYQFSLSQLEESIIIGMQLDRGNPNVSLEEAEQMNYAITDLMHQLEVISVRHDIAELESSLTGKRKYLAIIEKKYGLGR